MLCANDILRLISAFECCSRKYLTSKEEKLFRYAYWLVGLPPTLNVNKSVTMHKPPTIPEASKALLWEYFVFKLYNGNSILSKWKAYILRI